MKLIDKDALTAEIENLEKTYKECPTRNSYEEGLKDGRLIGYKDALHKIDTIEVKEVDLDKEIQDSIYNRFFDLEGIAIAGSSLYATVEDIVYVAKHFFELGLKANTGE